ncbi:hypothetical protein M127_5244 [Bacteroides fragilis str. S6L5]|nr:hypothetical protein M127_5244 [Bacteroides fragilis str. S6L5]
MLKNNQKYKNFNGIDCIFLEVVPVIKIWLMRFHAGQSIWNPGLT